MREKCARLTRSKRATRDVDSPLNIAPRCSLLPIEHSTLRFSIPGFSPRCGASRVSAGRREGSLRGFAFSSELPRFQIEEGGIAQSGGNQRIMSFRDATRPCDVIQMSFFLMRWKGRTLIFLSDLNARSNPALIYIKAEIIQVSLRQADNPW